MRLQELDGHSTETKPLAEVDTDRKTFIPTTETKRAWAAYTAFCTELAG